MKVARLYTYDDIRIEDMPIPDIGPNEALIKTKACGICSGDVMKWYVERKAPLVLGHEPTGEIVNTGRDVEDFAVGDRVFVHHHAPCLACDYCNRGDYVQCTSWRESKIIPGGVSEYICIPEMNLLKDTHKLPENLSYESATLIEPAACVIKSMKRARLYPNDTVLVIGLGVMGLLHILIAKHMGAGSVIGSDYVDFRLQKALEAGADHVINVKEKDLSREVEEITGKNMAHIVIVGPNSSEAMERGLSCVSRGGTVVFFTPAKPLEKLTIDPNELYFKDITIVTSYSCGPTDTTDALKVLKNGVVPEELLITHRFSIDGTAEAFTMTAQAQDSLKCVIIFD